MAACTRPWLIDMILGRVVGREQVCVVAAREEEGGGEGDTGGGEWEVEEVLGQGQGGVT